MKKGFDEERTERLLRHAATWTPSKEAPIGLAHRALRKAQKPQKPRKTSGISWWQVGTFCGSATAAVMVAAVHSLLPSPVLLTGTTTATGVKQTTAAKAAAMPWSQANPKPSIKSPMAAKPAAKAQDLSAAETVRPRVSIAKTEHPARQNASRRIAATAAAAGASHSLPIPAAPLQKASASLLPATEHVAQQTPRPLPANAVLLDEESPMVVPVVLTEEASDGSGIRMTPAAMVVPAGSPLPMETTE